jgi:hypothetical protein
LQKYQDKTTAESFVDALLMEVRNSAGVDLNAERATLITRYNEAGTTNAGRASAARAVADNSVLATASYNPSFVMFEYFGYLRRGAEPEGYAFWLNVMNNTGAGSYRGMVCSFLTSTEYQRRFGTVITRSNGQCAP